MQLDAHMADYLFARRTDLERRVARARAQIRMLKSVRAPVVELHAATKELDRYIYMACKTRRDLDALCARIHAWRAGRRVNLSR